jgi:hypothetical protein
MITKRLELGLITILSDGQVHLRDDSVLEEDGQELSRTYHRRVLAPSATIPADADPRLAAILRAVWTPAVVVAFALAQARPRPPGGPP